MQSRDALPGVTFIILATFLVNYLVNLAGTDEPATPGINPESIAATTQPIVEVDLQAIRRTLSPARMLRNDAVDRYRLEIESLIESGEDLEARTLLTRHAARANAEGDRKSLGYILALIGEISFEARDFAAARIYLDESLRHFIDSGDPIGEAYAYMQLGRMHIKSRSVARHAAEAYNLMLLARYQLSHFQYDAAVTNLQRVVEASLAIDRFGTAASALTSLARAFRSTGRTQDAEQALFRAAELHAASGRDLIANGILDELHAAGVDPYIVDRHRDAVDTALAQFQADTRQVVQARDYRTLYYQYRNSGQDERAWSFRVQAAQALAQTSSRAMYYRQPDVMAILYNSNFAMANARRYIDQARSLFETQGADVLAERAGALESSIF